MFVIHHSVFVIFLILYANLYPFYVLSKQFIHQSRANAREREKAEGRKQKAEGRRQKAKGRRENENKSDEKKCCIKRSTHARSL
jgi:hypothetical protein